MRRVSPGRCTGRPNAEEETALATEKIRGIDCDVFPAVCAATTGVVSPDPTPVGNSSSELLL